jgi:hypothetical protein
LPFFCSSFKAERASSHKGGVLLFCWCRYLDDMTYRIRLCVLFQDVSGIH